MKVKQHEAPEFQVIKMDEANAKFYAASTPGGNVSLGSSSNTSVGGTAATTSYTSTNATQWF